MIIADDIEVPLPRPAMGRDESPGIDLVPAKRITGDVPGDDNLLDARPAVVEPPQKHPTAFTRSL